MRGDRSAGPARALVDPQRRSPATPRRPSTGTTRHPTVVSWPTACRSAATSAARCTSSTSTTGEHLRDRIPHTRAALGRLAARRRRASPTPATPSRATSPRARTRATGARSTGTASARPGSRDELVWGDLPDKTAWPNVTISTDGRWLLVHVSLGWSRVDVHLIDRRTGCPDGADRGHRGGLVVRGRRRRAHRAHHPRRRPRPGRARRRSPTAWHDHWETIVAESDAVIDAVVSTSGSLLVLSSTSAVVAPRPLRPRRRRPRGASASPSSARSPGSAAVRDRDEAFFSLHLVRAARRRPVRWHPQRDRPDWSRLADLDTEPAAARAADYVVEQVRYPSTDGTEIPMFLVRAAGTAAAAPDTPCVLTGYGGFVDQPSAPTYSAGGRRGVRRRRPLRRRQHPGRRRGGRGVAPRRHARAQAAELRRLLRRRRLAGRRGLHLAATGSRSGAGATAAC